MFGAYNGTTKTIDMQSDGTATFASGQFKVFGSNGQTEIGPVGSPNIFLRGTDGSAEFANTVSIPSSSDTL